MRDQGPRFNQSVQDGRGHEGAASGQLPDDVHGLVGQGACHRFGQLADLSSGKGTQLQMGLRVETPQSVVGGQLLGSYGEHQQDMRLRPTRLGPQGVPSFDELDRQLVAPLAVIQNDHGWTRGRAERVQEVSQRLHASILAKLLRQIRAGAGPPQFVGQMRKCRHDSVQVDFQLVADPTFQFRMRFGLADEFIDDAVQQLERSLSHIARCMAPHDPHVLCHAATGHFDQQSSLTAAGLTLQQHQVRLAPMHLLNAVIDPFQFFLAAHQGRFCQAGTHI